MNLASQNQFFWQLGANKILSSKFHTDCQLLFHGLDQAHVKGSGIKEFLQLMIASDTRSTVCKACLNLKKKSTGLYLVSVTVGTNNSYQSLGS